MQPDLSLNRHAEIFDSVQVRVCVRDRSTVSTYTMHSSNVDANNRRMILPDRRDIDVNHQMRFDSFVVKQPSTVDFHETTLAPHHNVTMWTKPNLLVSKTFGVETLKCIQPCDFRHPRGTFQDHCWYLPKSPVIFVITSPHLVNWLILEPRSV